MSIFFISEHKNFYLILIFDHILKMMSIYNTLFRFLTDIFTLFYYILSLHQNHSSSFKHLKNKKYYIKLNNLFEILTENKVFIYFISKFKLINF